MSWKTVQILLVHELRMLLRDRRTIILSIVLPLVVMPLFIFASKVVNERRQKKLEETLYQYAVTGTEAQKVRDLIAKTRESLPKPLAQKDGKEDDLVKFKFAEFPTQDPAASLKSKVIHFYLEALSGAEADELAKKDKKPADTDDTGSRARPPAERTRLQEVPLVKIYYQGDRDASQAGQRKMREFLIRARRTSQDEMLEQRGFSIDPRMIVPSESRSVATKGQVTGSYVGRFLTIFLLMFMLTGGSVVAMDIIAGEKERGSLETLLTTSVRRSEIVAAKQLAIVSVALVITFIQVANILVYVTLKVFKLPKDFVIEAPPATIFTLLLLFIPVAALVASVLLMISAYAKSYKEAQLYFFPVYLTSLFLGSAAVLPGVSLRSAIVLVPLANVSVAVREVMVGKYDWPMILLTFVVVGWTALRAIQASAKMLSKEHLITASESDAADLVGGPALFPKHVLRWYAVMAAVLFAVAANIPSLATFRRQLIFNELVIFLGGPLLMIWKYRLNIRDALALRAVKPAVWLAVLLIVPSGFLTATGVFRLANLVVPVPREALEQFSRSLLPKDIPLWQLYVFLSIVPGIFEEIGFRGLLLYGLRRRVRPALLTLVVGGIFGLFHVNLFRIIPTAFMGIILTAIALLTGSIFPGMVAHAGNNAFALWFGLQGFPSAGLHWGVHFGAAVTLALSFYILYRNRTLYPGLKFGVGPRQPFIGSEDILA